MNKRSPLKLPLALDIYDLFTEVTMTKTLLRFNLHHYSYTNYYNQFYTPMLKFLFKYDI